MLDGTPSGIRIVMHSPVRLLALAAFAALLSGSGFNRGAAAQPGDAVAPSPTESGIEIDWQVKNRFRLFRREADFERHVAASRAGSQLAAERLLQASAGARGWAQREVDHLCVDRTGAVADICERDGE